MPDYVEILKNLKQRRDELRLQLHLASKDAEDEGEEAPPKRRRYVLHHRLGLFASTFEVDLYLEAIIHCLKQIAPKLEPVRSSYVSLSDSKEYVPGGQARWTPVCERPYDCDRESVGTVCGRHDEIGKCDSPLQTELKL